MNLIRKVITGDIKISLEKEEIIATSRVIIGATALGFTLLNNPEVHEIKEKEYNVIGKSQEVVVHTITEEDILVDECREILKDFDSTEKSYVKENIVLDVVKDNIDGDREAIHEKNILNEDTDLELPGQLIALAAEISKDPEAYNYDNSIYTDGVTGYVGDFVITAYCGCSACCGKSTGITASGEKATANHTIAADSRFSFGTELCIDGVTYEVEDRGGAIKGNRIDRFFNSHSEAISFGKRYASVYSVDSSESKTLALRYSK